MSRLEHVRWLTESFSFNGKGGEHEEDLDQGAGIVGNLTLSIDFAKCNDPGVGEDGQCIDNTGSFDDEIYFRLGSPNGTMVSLVDPWAYSGASVGAGRVDGGASLRRGRLAGKLGGRVPTGTLPPARGRRA